MTSLIEVYRRWPTKEAAVAHLEKVRWPDGPHCPKCGADTVARKAEPGQADRLQCWSCERSSIKADSSERLKPRQRAAIWLPSGR